MGIKKGSLLEPLFGVKKDPKNRSKNDRKLRSKMELKIRPKKVDLGKAQKCRESGFSGPSGIPEGVEKGPKRARLYL